MSAPPVCETRVTAFHDPLPARDLDFVIVNEFIDGIYWDEIFI